MREQSHIYNDFMENLSPSLSILINATQGMLDRQDFDDHILLEFVVNNYTPDEILNVFEEDVELTTLYHHIQKRHVVCGQSLCAYSDPNLGLMYKINAETEENGKVSFIYITLYSSDDGMLADLRVELAQHSRSGLFKRKLEEEELLHQFVCGGIDKKIYKRVVALIKKHNDDICVVDHKHYMEHTITIGQRTVKCMCRTLVLKESGRQNSHREEQIWYVPDIKIRQALIKYRKEQRRRGIELGKNASALTLKDVGRIINIATDGGIYLQTKTA